jgi:hypothetical protein
MATGWYYRIGGQQIGPVTFQELAEMVRAGTLTADHRVRRDLTQEWMAARDVIGLFRAAGVVTGQGASPEPEAGPGPDQSPREAPPPIPAAPSLPPPTPPASPLDPPQPRRRRRYAPMGFAAAAVLVGLALAYHAWSGRPILPRWLRNPWAMTVLRDDFSQKTLNPAHWSRLTLADAVQVKDGQLHLVIPRGPDGRPPVGVQSRFQIDGDFDVRVDYGLVSVPAIKTGDIRVHLSVHGPGIAGAMAHFIQPWGPHQQVFWRWRDKERGLSDVWIASRTTERSGSMRLHRLGEDLIGYVAGPGGEFRELGRTSFGNGSITSFMLSAAFPATDGNLEITYDNVEIQADRITLLTPGSRHRRWLWPAGIALSVAVAAAAWYWRFHRAKRAR